MNELALFAGAGGGLLASRLLGWTTIAACEIEDYPRRVILTRQAEGHLERFPIWDDIRTFDGKPWRGIVDVITAGFPCQFYSSAARGRNRKDRDLWTETARVIREVRPRYVFLENHPSAFNGEALIYCPSKLGAPHRRPRGWMVAYADSESESRCTFDEEVAGLCQIPECTWWSENMARTVGVDDGMANRMDRLKAIGNGQVPLVAAQAWSVLSSFLLPDTRKT